MSELGSTVGESWKKESLHTAIEMQPPVLSNVPTL